MRQEEAGRLNWTAHVKDLLFTYGFGYAWIVQDVGNDKEFLKMFTDRIKLCFKQQWHSALSDLINQNTIDISNPPLTQNYISVLVCHMYYKNL